MDDMNKRSKIDIKCHKCHFSQTVDVINAWISNIKCQECAEDLFDNSKRNKYLEPIIDLKIALIFNGMDRLEKQDTRGAVLDIYCAMELQLKQKITNHLKSRNVDDELIEYLTADLWRINTTKELLKVLKFTQPEKMENMIRTLKKMRDRVAHGGYTPPYLEAHKVIGNAMHIFLGVRAPSNSLNLLGRLQERNKS